MTITTFDQGTWHIVRTDTESEMVQHLNDQKIERDRLRGFFYDSSSDQFVSMYYRGYNV